MRARDIDRFEKVEAQLAGLYDEMQLLAKKSPDGAVNKFKLQFVNAVLADSNAFLPKANRPFESFEQFDEEALPSNSDVVLILKQYLGCMEELRSAHVIASYGNQWVWKIDGVESERRAKPPGKLR